ncbi:MAG: hypothetical protein LC793_12025 [Thermomicrobia bacterium]|nr:hypothetical protein [Thermomicrobia bacterium]
MAKVPSSPSLFDPHEMALRGRIGAHRLHATHDPKETTIKAREAFMSRFEREVDPHGTLPEGERTRRADHARAAYFAALAYKSATARKQRNGNRAA